MSLVYALDLQLERILEEGLEKRFARHSAMAARVHDWALANGLGLFAPEGYRSHTVTAVENRLGLEFANLNKYLINRVNLIIGYCLTYQSRNKIK